MAITSYTPEQLAVFSVGEIGNRVIRAKETGAWIVVLGYGVSNRPLTEILFAMGAPLCVCDRRSPEELGETALELQRAGVRFCTDEDGWQSLHPALIFRSPGTRPDLPAIRAAVDAGAYLTDEMEWFLELTPATVLGITGSDGKSTTTTMTALILKEAGKGEVYCGGNLGLPLLSFVPQMTKKDFAVVELSSFQLFALRHAPHRAALTNITPNHLNWHTDMEEYIQAKTHIYDHPRCEMLVTNAENDITAALAATYAGKGAGALTLFTTRRTNVDEITANCPGAAALLCSDGTVVRCEADGTRTPLLPIDALLLPGDHNLQNLMTAIGLTWKLVPLSAIETVARTFGGVEHRLELVRTLHGVKYYNSSIDSSPTRTAAALSALPRRSAVVICGGYDKNIPFAPLADTLCDRAAAVVLTGATAHKIHAALLACPAYDAERLPVVIEPSFDRAIGVAAALAAPGQSVLLSPACASFDAFVNFEARGRAFKEIVMKMESERTLP